MCIPQGGGARGGLGSSSSSGGLGRGAIIRAGIGGAVIGGTAAAVNNMVLDPEIPPLPPGMDLNETPIIPCFEPGIGLGGVGDILPPVLSTPLDSSSFPIFFGTPLSPGIEWPNFLTIERLKTYYGEVIEVRKLSAREVRELGLHEEKKSTKGSKAKDDIYVEPKTGRYWIRRGGGPLIEL